MFEPLRIFDLILAKFLYITYLLWYIEIYRQISGRRYLSIFYDILRYFTIFYDILRYFSIYMEGGHTLVPTLAH